MKNVCGLHPCLHGPAPGAEALVGYPKRIPCGNIMKTFYPEACIRERRDGKEDERGEGGKMIERRAIPWKIC